MSEHYTIQLLQNFIDELDVTARSLMRGKAEEDADVVMEIRAALLRAVSPHRVPRSNEPNAVNTGDTKQAQEQATL